MELPARFKDIINNNKDQKTSLEVFLKDNPGLVAELTPSTLEAYTTICASVSHWRSRRARSFFLDRFHDLAAIENHPSRDLILQGAVSLSTVHWALAQHCFSAMTSLPGDASLMTPWIALAQKLYDLNVDVAIVFTKQTPDALEAFGPENILQWGEQAAVAIQWGNPMMKATRTYLEESILFQKEGSVLLSRWPFFLEQAVRISKFSSEGAEVFIRQGVKMCLILGEKDTRTWVEKGLEGCSLEPFVENRNFRRKVTPDQMVCAGEEEMIKYFSGISASALVKRDDLVGGVLLKDRVNTLALICEALLGKRMKIASNQSLLAVKGFTGTAATDGRTIYLPESAPSFKLYKLMALHQTMVPTHEILAETESQKKPSCLPAPP